MSIRLSSNPLYSDILDAWYKEHRLGIQESTAYNYYRALPVLKKYFEGIQIQDIDSEMVYDFVQHLRKQYDTVTSARLYCKVLTMSFTNFSMLYLHNKFDFLDLSCPFQSLRLDFLDHSVGKSPG